MMLTTLKSLKIRLKCFKTRLKISMDLILTIIKIFLYKRRIKIMMIHKKIVFSKKKIIIWTLLVSNQGLFQPMIFTKSISLKTLKSSTNKILLMILQYQKASLILCKIKPIVFINQPVEIKCSSIQIHNTKEN